MLELPPEYRAGVVRYIKEAAVRFEQALVNRKLEEIPFMTPEKNHFASRLRE
ncbi:MAG: hypothetical protein IJS69_06040 [Selenomonadaceae bacterium]|nr:hypothetical protein [Selenomonadaceae bacterium]